ncbi:ATP-binding protein (plasmid) [Streptomyces sp. AHU1]|uniref:ATP-binding protein n=1 Tax=Streptomyces sp. AHU1 TaxID=3377215 RepID=UPI0038783AF0
MRGNERNSATASPDVPAQELLGRGAVLAMMSDLLTSQGGGALVLGGEPGIGKTSLLMAADHMASESGYRVLAVSGSETSVDTPFHGLQQLLSEALDAVDALPSAQSRALLTALGLRKDVAPQPFLVALAVLNLLAERAAEQPLLICIDDLQWVDQASAEALAFVARRLGHDPIVLLATSRTHSGERPVPAGLPRVDLTALKQEDATALLHKLRGDLPTAVKNTILQLAQGNPLALVEVGSAWTGSGSQQQSKRSDLDDGIPLTSRLERAFFGRLRDLPGLAQDLVLIAAVNSGDQLAEILAGATTLSRQSVTADDLQPAVTAGLVQLDNFRVRFRHPLVRSGILQAVGRERLFAAHRALAQLLETDTMRATWHEALALDTPDEDVAARLEANHLQAIQRGSSLTAIQMLRRAAELSPESADAGRRLLLAAEQGFGLGRADLVRRLLDAAAREDLRQLQRARMRWLEEIFEDGVPGDPIPVFELCALAERSAEAGEFSLALNLLQGAALRCWWAYTGEEARERVVSVTRSLRDSAKDPRYVAAIAVASPVREGATVREIVLEALQDVELNVDADGLLLLGQAAHAVGEQAFAAEFLDRAETRLRSQGRLGLLPHVLGMQVQVRLDLGDWRMAAQAAAEGHRLALDTGQPIWSVGTLVGDAKVAVFQGDTAEALRLADEVEAQVGPKGMNDLLACAELVRGIALLLNDRAEESYDVLQSLFDKDSPFWDDRESYGAIGFLADAAVRSGRIDEARPLLRSIQQRYEDSQAALLRINQEYAEAVLADDACAEELYQRALRRDLARWPWPRARLELAYGSWLRRRRRGTEWRAPLRAAAASFEAIGAVPWLQIAREELRAAGERMSTNTQQRITAVELTDQEMQIARLAAEGLSNRQIGELLYLSPRTVGSHLYRLFPKLGVTARSQLAEMLKQL